MRNLRNHFADYTAFYLTLAIFAGMLAGVIGIGLERSTPAQILAMLPF